MINGNNAELMALTYEVFTKNINGHFHRSFGIYPDQKEMKIFNVYVSFVRFHFPYPNIVHMIFI